MLTDGNTLHKFIGHISPVWLPVSLCGSTEFIVEFTDPYHAIHHISAFIAFDSSPELQPGKKTTLMVLDERSRHSLVYALG